MHIFDYPDSRLSGLFTEVPMSPDNRGLTVLVSMSCMCCGLNVAKCNLGKVKIEPMLVANASCGLSF